jgi:tetratricopeptide (TPR) repeat protein
MFKNERAHELLTQNFKNEKSAVKIIAFIAATIKEYSAVKEAIKLYEICLEIEPSNISVALNYVHILEINYDYEKAIDFCKKYLSQNLDLSVGEICSNSKIYEIIKNIEFSNRQDYLHESEITKKMKNDNIHIKLDSKKNILVYENDKKLTVDFNSDIVKKYSQNELDLLAFYFSVAKIFFVCGIIAPLPSLFEVIEPCRHTDLFKTSIRNENAYFSCIGQLLVSLLPKLPIKKDINKIYVCGDSHSLSPSWNILNNSLLVNRLVTGLKCYHLRKESAFFPKYNFLKAIENSNYFKIK